MLVHICCSVDSHYFLQELNKAYPSENLVGFFYNPNIHPKEEYDLRLQDVKRSCNMLNIKLIEGSYNLSSWLKDVKGYEDAPEKGDRCNICFDNRLIETAKLAKELNIDRFTTTLLSSPMKEQQVLYSQGDEIARQNNLEFIKINVRTNGGVNKQNELAKKDNLYRQNYCGCKFALKAQRDKQNKISLEMLSSVNKQILPASIESRIETFKKRDSIEKENGSYILMQKNHVVWRLLSAKVLYSKEIVPSYIIARSASKKQAKSSNIIWIKQELNNLHFLYKSGAESYSDFISRKYAEYANNDNLLIGHSKRDDSVFLDIAMLNFLLDCDYNGVGDMMKNPPSYEDELRLRYILCGMESVNAIIVLDSKYHHDLIINIDSVFQNESVYVIAEEKLKKLG